MFWKKNTVILASSHCEVERKKILDPFGFLLLLYVSVFDLLLTSGSCASPPKTKPSDNFSWSIIQDLTGPRDRNISALWMISKLDGSQVFIHWCGH